MEDSILKSIKAVTGYEIDSAFDVDIMMHINTAFATLTDLGVGPQEGFMVVDQSAKWSEFYGDADLTLNRCQTYVYLKVRSYFDPPGTSYHLTAMKDQMEELEIRIRDNQELKNWTNPNPPRLPGDNEPVNWGDPIVLDGGVP